MYVHDYLKGTVTKTMEIKIEPGGPEMYAHPVVFKVSKGTEFTFSPRSEKIIHIWTVRYGMVGIHINKLEGNYTLS